MKLGIVAGYSPASMSVPMDLIREAEGLGYSSVWTAEAYGSDAVSPAAWILAQTTKIPDSVPHSITITPANKCARPEIRSHPYR